MLCSVAYTRVGPSHYSDVVSNPTTYSSLIKVHIERLDSDSASEVNGFEPYKGQKGAMPQTRHLPISSALITAS